MDKDVFVLITMKVENSEITIIETADRARSRSCSDLMHVLSDLHKADSITVSSE
jgi:hypothetical protein